MVHHEPATLTADDLVTGEAVALDLPPAGLGSRMASGLIDVVATSLLLVTVLVVVSVAVLDTDAALVWVGIVLSLALVFVGVPTAVETLTRGRSLGKMALGLRSVRDDAGPVSFHHAFVRSLVGFVEIYLFLGAPAFFSALLSSKGKRLGDFAAGTYVVRERVKLVLPPPPTLPPALAGWARSADLAPLPTSLALAVRQYLARLPQISPEAAAPLGRRLAEQVAAYVAPPPPPDTPDWAFLSAVVAVRRERDLARLGREQALRDRLAGRR